MKQEQINELMKRYLEGDTTLEEERQLYQYFREQDDIPQSLLPYRQMMLDLAAAEGTEKEDEPLLAEFSRQESHSIGWRRYAAILVGIVLLSGDEDNLMKNLLAANNVPSAYLEKAGEVQDVLKWMFGK